MIRIRQWVGFAFVILSLSAVAALAQDTTGTILGTVTDASGAVLPGVTVTVKNTDTSQSRTIVSDSSGRYRMALLPPGHYEVAAQLQGFQTMVRDPDGEAIFDDTGARIPTAGKIFATSTDAREIQIAIRFVF